MIHRCTVALALAALMAAVPERVPAQVFHIFPNGESYICPPTGCRYFPSNYLGPYVWGPQSGGAYGTGAYGVAPAIGPYGWYGNWGTYRSGPMQIIEWPTAAQLEERHRAFEAMFPAPQTVVPTPAQLPAPIPMPESSLPANPSS